MFLAPPLDMKVQSPVVSLPHLVLTQISLIPGEVNTQIGDGRENGFDAWTE